MDSKYKISLINKEKNFVCLKMDNSYNASKFSMTELFSNDNGRTSSSKVIGVLAMMICIILFAVMVIFYMVNVAEGAMILDFIDRIISLFGISTALLGIKSVTSSFGKNKMQISNNDSPQKKMLNEQGPVE